MQTKEQMGNRIKLTAYNSTFAIGGVSCSKDSFVGNQTLVFQIKFCGKSPALQVAANVSVHCKKTETDDRMTKEFLLHKGKRKKSNRTVRHIWFLPTNKANAQKPKKFALTHRTQTE